MNDKIYPSMVIRSQAEAIELLEKENQQLKEAINNFHYCPYDDKCGELYDCSKEEYQGMVESNIKLSLQLDLYKSAFDEIREYITSYSSIHTIQFGTEEDSLNDIEANKMLDEKTITEMTHRYLKVHDKLLQILDKVNEQK